MQSSEKQTQQTASIQQGQPPTPPTLPSLASHSVMVGPSRWGGSDGSAVSVCGPVEVVLAGLEVAGFRELPKPLVVGGAPFDFDALRLVPVSRMTSLSWGGLDTDPPRLVRLLSGLNRSLDRLESWRPVSAIVLGVRPEADTLHELENSARVVLIESREPALTDVRAAISVVLPLELPETTQTALDPLDELLAGLGDEVTDEHRRLIGAARAGPGKARETFRLSLDEAIRRGTVRERTGDPYPAPSDRDLGFPASHRRLGYLP